MPQRVPPIARIRLARSLPRLLLVPVVVALAGGGAIAAGLVVGGLVGMALAVLGGIVVIGALGASAVLLSVRLEVEESAVGLTWLGGERIYPLSPGPVTRVRLRGEHASRIRARTGALGWAVGRARLRDEEDIEVVRLAPTRTAILVPTERGRLAIAVANDDLLLDALSRAARARQRLEALSDRVPAPAPIALEPPQPPDEAEIEPEALTGIERARLADEGAAAEAAAQAAAQIAADMAAQAAPVAAPPQPVIKPVQADLEPPPEIPPRRSRLRLIRRVLRRPRPRVAFVLLPLLGAAVAWGAGIAAGRMPEAGTDLARLTSLALVLAGPATSVGAILALAWWPRIVGVVVAGGLAASVFIGRALIGG
ncbi:MAG: hypothetical protein ABIP01_00710 [Candidatus Limnocylindria bacterium]